MTNPSNIKPSNRPLDASMLDGLPDPVFLVDQDLIIVDCNRSARDLLGEDALNNKLEESIVDDEIAGSIKDSLSGMSVPRREVSLSSPMPRDYEFIVWRLPDLKSPGPAWAMVSLHDVTGNKKNDQMRADFVANVSHEMRSPLSSLLGFIETLRGPASDDPKATERFLGIMEAEAERMTRLINDLLTLSKVETEEHIPPKDVLDIAGLLRQNVATQSLRAQEQKMEINLKLPKKVPQVIGDTDELTQVFQNLIANAINYGKPQSKIGIEVTAPITLASTGEPGIAVAVINLGDGIREEEIPRLTERFYRADKSRSRKMGGTGLGLAIVKHIVARHRGHLQISSVPNGKTNFTVQLPQLKD
jgi:two-component system phosphate regulon sensor histidine kinase PhoR